MERRGGEGKERGERGRGCRGGSQAGSMAAAIDAIADASIRRGGCYGDTHSGSATCGAFSVMPMYRYGRSCASGFSRNGWIEGARHLTELTSVARATCMRGACSTFIGRGTWAIGGLGSWTRCAADAPNVMAQFIGIFFRFPRKAHDVVHPCSRQPSRPSPGKNECNVPMYCTLPWRVRTPVSQGLLLSTCIPACPQTAPSPPLP